MTRYSHHTDLHLQKFSEVIFRVAVQVVLLDFKHNRAAYIDNTRAALLALQARLQDSGMIIIASQVSVIYMLHLSGIKIKDMRANVFGAANRPYSKYGGPAGGIGAKRLRAKAINTGMEQTSMTLE